jgi:uncharacterized protein with HEPN domain
MPKDDLIRMRHMLDAARKAISFAEGRSRDDLDNEPMFAFAVMRAIEVLG